VQPSFIPLIPVGEYFVCLDLWFSFDLSDGMLEPGQNVSVDLYKSTIPDRLANTKGRRRRTRKRAMFYDLASRFIFVQHQTHLTSRMAIDPKHSFVCAVNEFGIVV
jgi:hypothetical protein